MFSRIFSNLITPLSQRCHLQSGCKVDALYLFMIGSQLRSPTKVQPSNLLHESPYARPPPQIPPIAPGGIASGLGIQKRLANRYPSNQALGSGNVGPGQFQPRKSSFSDKIEGLPPLQIKKKPEGTNQRSQRPNHRTIFGI